MQKIIGTHDAVIPVHYHPVVLFEYFQQKKLDLNILFKNAAINPSLLQNKDAKLSHSQLSSLLQQGSILLNCPALGLIFGSRLPPSSNGLLGMSVLCSENIEQAISIAVRYKKSISPVTTLSWHHVGEFSYVQCAPAMDEHESSNMFVEVCFASLYAGIKQIIPELAPYLAFEFAFEAPDYHADYNKYLNNNVKFNGVKNRIIIESGWLNVALPYANKRVINEALEMMDVMQESEEIGVGLISAVHLLLSEMPVRDISLEILSERLCTSVSSLKRKLSVHGTSFQKLSDTIRMEKACELLEREEYSISEIASIIGFSDAASFRKAFKRWAKQTPQDYRQHVFSWLKSSLVADTA